MSRFDAARRGRIAVWTGAALAWGTAVTLAGQRPMPADADHDEIPPVVTEESSALSPLPALPDGGLVIIRYRPSMTSAPEVRTVYVQGAAPAAPPATAAPATPAPRSGGS